MKAMIFSAGLGTRFKPWTDRHPKALAVINGKSLLQRNIEYLQQYGITEVIVNVHHFAQQVIDALEKNKGWGSHVVISDEQDELLDTGGGLLHAARYFTPGERIITCNVDILTDLDISRQLAFHEQHSPLITVSISKRDTSRYLLFNEKDRLCGWTNIKTGEEKIALPSAQKIPMAYDCVVVLEYETLQLVPFTGKFSLIDLYLALAKDHTILGFDHTGDRWVDVGKPEAVEVAAALFK